MCLQHQSIMSVHFVIWPKHIYSKRITASSTFRCWQQCCNIQWNMQAAQVYHRPQDTNITNKQQCFETQFFNTIVNLKQQILSYMKEWNTYLAHTIACRYYPLYTKCGSQNANFYLSTQSNSHNNLFFFGSMHLCTWGLHKLAISSNTCLISLH